jgi:hypothetical protein
MNDPNGDEQWTATTQLRNRKVTIGKIPFTSASMYDRVLEQLWVSDKGREEWRTVPDADANPDEEEWHSSTGKTLYLPKEQP